MIRRVTVQSRELLGSNSVFSAERRANIDSKRTADERCNTKLSQSLELRINQLRSELRLRHLEISPENLGMIRRYLDGHDHASQPAPGLPVHQSPEKPLPQPTLIERGT